MQTRSLKTHVTAALLLCILLPTALIGGAAYGFLYNMIKDNRITTVGQVADARYEQLLQRLREDHKRNSSLLTNLVNGCRGRVMGINACAQSHLDQFADFNDAVGLRFHSGVESDLTVGTEAIPVEVLAKSFQSGQLAVLSTNPQNNTGLYSMISTDWATGFQLVTTYPAQELQSIFVNAPALGQSGETFLADSQGLFITQPRYPSQQGLIKPISAMPMERCLRKESGETLDLDYRNIPIIHGFRFVPEIGGGCIMAHIDQAEAFAPLRRLMIGLGVTISLVVLFAWLIATRLSRSLAKPILALADSAQALSNGDFTQHIHPTRVTEIAELSQRFTRMAGQLDNALGQLKTSEHELETKVLERTAELEERHRSYYSVIQTIGDGFWRVDKEGRLLEVNPAYVRLSGYSETELVGMHITDLEAQELPEETAEHIRKVIQQGYDTFETRHRRKNGSVWDVEVNSAFIQADGGYFVAFFRDITERKQFEQELQIAATAFETQEGIIITDANEIILRVNQAFTQITGYTAEDAIGHKPSILKSGRHDPEFYRTMHGALQHDGLWEGELWDRHKDGHLYPKWLIITAVKDSAGCISHYVGNFTDISERKASEDKVKSLAFYDPLTALANRRLVTERIEHAIALYPRTGHQCALLFLDLDNFKRLNDAHGHAAGDELLIEVARRLKTCVRKADTVARWGGDEFTVLLEELSNRNDDVAVQINRVAEKIVTELAKPYCLTKVDHHGSCSMGIALLNDPDTTATTLLAQADTAMYAAKKSGKNTFRFFDPIMLKKSEQQVTN